jgi:predicted phosphodiesterase
MRFAVFSDVHGNLPALERMLEHAEDVDGYICLGDTVNYGPWSNECVDLITSLSNVVYIKGNHEQYFLDGHYSGTHPVARAFFDFCFPTFTRQAKLKGLPEEYEFHGYIFRHTINDSYIYPDTSIALDGNYVIGHSHHQFIYKQPPFILCNPGSVGQNRKLINVINYAILDDETMSFDLRSLVYDEQVILKEMKARRYPQLCIDYYDGKERLTS